MAYDNTIPATGHSGSQDYTGMRGNFAQIQTSFSVDHEPLAVGAGIEGFHKQSSYVQSASDPAPGVNLGIAYSKLSGSHTELFYEGEQTTGRVVQITNQTLITGSGQGMIPGGLQVRVATTGAMTGNSFTINITPPFPNSILGAFVTSVGNARTWSVSYGQPSSTFIATASSPLGNDVFCWVAIGY